MLTNFRLYKSTQNDPCLYEVCQRLMSLVAAGVVNAVEVVNAFEGEGGLQRFKDWALAPGEDLIASAPGTASSRGRGATRGRGRSVS